MIHTQTPAYYYKFRPISGGNTEFFGGSSSTKKCDHNCDKKTHKKQLETCIEYAYISELMLGYIEVSL